MMMPLTRLQGRYEIRETLGAGGMGVVHRAYDPVIRREVALKTLKDSPGPTALSLFQRECAVLASISHPNIVEIFDLGEYEDEGVKRPYFVMPLLPGCTLESLIRTSSPRLTVDRVVGIMTQASRGLQAAHEKGLIHRDIKPSNLFILDDDSVKLIDFGVAHLVDSQTTVGHKGTLLYMAPEQIEMKPPSPLSDVYSLAVVCYEAFTGRRPFEGRGQTETIQAILKHIPPPASDLNPAVSPLLARVLHKAMAKQPWHRFSSAREFTETLQKAARGEAIEAFDPARLHSRLDSATRAYDQGDFGLASEILAEMEAQGEILPEIATLRYQIDSAVRRQSIAQLLRSAQTCLDHQEFPLALQKLAEVLRLDPENAAALGMRSSIESRQNELKVEEWLRLANLHLGNRAFSHAREALRNLLQLKPSDSRALTLLGEVTRRENDFQRAEQTKLRLFDSAVKLLQGGDVSAALTKLERLMALGETPVQDDSGAGSKYQALYQQVRTEHESIKKGYADARRMADERRYAEALSLCAEFLGKYPGHALFQSLQFDIEEMRRQELSARIAEISSRVEAEPDLDRRVAILEEGAVQYPGESYFERSLRLMRDKRDLVQSITAKARMLEERASFDEAISQWETVRTIYPQYPGLAFELERLEKRREQQARSEAKARWVQQIDTLLEVSEYAAALEVIAKAGTEFPNDPELEHLAVAARQGTERTATAFALLEEGRSLCARGQADAGLDCLRRAFAMDERNSSARAALVRALVEQARVQMDSDWQAAERLATDALKLDPAQPAAKGVLAFAGDRRREEAVQALVGDARRMQAAGDAKSALELVNQALRNYPSEPRLLQLHGTLQRAITEIQASMPTAALDAEFDAIFAAGSPPQAPSRSPATAAGQASAAPPQLHQAAFRPAPVSPAPAAAPAPEALPAGWVAEAAAEPFRPPAPSRSRRKYYIVAAAVAAVAVLAWLLVFLAARMRGTGKPVLVAVEVRTTPPGASIRVNNKPAGQSNTRIQLAPGSYAVEAQLAGFHPATLPIVVSAGKDMIADVPLHPVAQVLQISTNLDNASAALGGAAAVAVPGGQLLIPNVPAGKQVLKISAGAVEARLQVEFVAGAVPVVAPLEPVKGAALVVLAGLADKARLYSTVTPADVRIGERAVGRVTSVGLEVAGLTPGTQQVRLTQENWTKDVTFETGNAPALTVHLFSDAPTAPR